MIFKDHFDYKGKAQQLRVERTVLSIEQIIRSIMSLRHQLVMFGFLRPR